MRQSIKINLFGAIGAAALAEGIYLQTKNTLAAGICIILGSLCVQAAIRFWKRSDRDPGSRVLKRAGRWRLAGNIVIAAGIVWIVFSPLLMRETELEGIGLWLYLASFAAPLVGLGLRTYADDLEEL